MYKNSDHVGGIAIIGVVHNDADQSYSSALGVGEVARTIDGVSGSITTAGPLDNGITIYMAAYHPSFDPKRVNVTIISNYPWDEGTLKLLQTIHVKPN